MALPAGTTLTWDAGSAGPRSVNVSIVDNGTPDSERVFTASIAPSAGEGNVAIGDPAQTVVSIADDDAEIRFAETEVMVSEDDGSATLTVERFTTGTGATYGATDLCGASAWAVAPCVRGRIPPPLDRRLPRGSPRPQLARHPSIHWSS